MEAHWVRICALAGLLSAPAAAFPLEGRVIDAFGEPVAGAIVTARPLETEAERARRWLEGKPAPVVATARTAADGGFRLGVKALPVPVEAHAPGFGLAFTMARDRRAINLVVRAAPLRRGTVVAAGRPVSGARLLWSTRGTPGAALELESGADGTFAVPDPAAWVAHVTIRHPGFDAAEIDPRGLESLVLELPSGRPLEGRVVTAAPERPVAGALVRIDGRLHAISGADGTFRIASAPSGWRLVEAQAGHRVGWASPGTGPLRIVVQRGGEVSGVVREATTGRPISGARVSVGIREREGYSGRDVFTDSRGRFTMRGLRPARYTLAATADGYSLEGAREAPVDLRRARSMRLQIPMREQGRIAGIVVDPDCRAVAGAAVTLGRAGGPAQYSAPPVDVPRHWAYSGIDGRFELRLDPGVAKPPDAYALRVVRRGFAAALVALGPERAPHVIRLRPGVPLSGRVRGVEGEPLAGVAVAAVEDRELPGGGSTSDGLTPERWPGHAVTGPDGGFSLQVENRSHHLLFHQPGRLSHVERSRSPGAPDPLTVTLGPGVRISGRVERSGVPVVAVNVLLRPRGAEGPRATARLSDRYRSTLTDTAGRFTFDALPSGPYALLVREGQEYGLPQRRIDVEAPAHVTIPLSPTGGLRVRVTDRRDGRPVPTFTLRLRTNRLGGLPHDREERATSVTGTFEATDLAVGAYQVVVDSDLHQSEAREDVVVEQGQVANVEFTLAAGTTLDGHVTDARTAPLADVRVAYLGPVGRETTTDSAGAYELRGVPSGPGHVLFGRDGFSSLTKHVGVWPLSASLDAQLGEGLTLSGVVVLESGAPATGARVRARSADWGIDVAATAADALGHFRLEGLPPGRYSVWAESAGHIGVQPNVDPEHGSALRLALLPPRTAVLFGRVVGPSSTPEPPPRTVRVETADGRSASAPVQADGRYRVDAAPAGRVRVTVWETQADGQERHSGLVVEFTLVADSKTEETLTLFRAR